MTRVVPRLRRFVARLLVPTLAGFVGGAIASRADAQEWAVNKAKSRITFHLGANGQAIEGTFSSYKVEIRFDAEDPANGEINAVIDVASARTQQPQVDAFLQTPDWFNTAAYPTARLASVSISEDGADSYKMEGDLTLKGVTERITVPFKLESEGGEGQIQAEITLSRRAFGIGAAEAGAGPNLDGTMRISIDLHAKNMDN